ncbi:MAG: hypothetical protein D4S01_10495 [Dehalococcoidia bacterium]|nr:MAG: hypothetical protein D4S01_10495 [Dehalococcoidia bacterium]
MANKTAQNLVIDALRTCGAIAAIEVPSANESVHALGELNNLIAQLDLDSLWPYSNSVVNYLTSDKKEYTIGLPDESYDAKIAGDGSSSNLITTVPLSINVGESVYVYNLSSTSNNESIGNGTYEVTEVFDQYSFKIDAGNGEAWTESCSFSTNVLESNIPDIPVERPNRLTSVSIVESDHYQSLLKVDYEDFIESSRYDGRYFSYNPTYPFGTIIIGAVGKTTEIRYEYKSTELSLGDEIRLPAGYYGTLQYQLAAILCVQYGINPSLIQHEANKRIMRIKRLNQGKVKLIKSDFKGGRGRYNGITDSWGL